MESFRKAKRIPAERIRERIETVRILRRTDRDLYEIVKDAATGEHYLHYSFRLPDPGGGDGEERFSHFLPLESDDVLAIVMDSRPYEYPDHWNRPYLRGGPDGSCLWYDPGQLSAYEEDERIGQEIVRQLREFKKKGRFDESSLRAFLGDLDRLVGDPGERDP